MQFKQEFTVAEDVQRVWDFFQQADQVAQCMPGIDNIEIIDPEQLSVRLTQKVGPLSASFDTTVRITQRQAPTLIEFTLIGKAVRGAVGNFRASNIVTLTAQGAQTHVAVAGEAALAGALGSVGQRIIAKQAEKLTAEFASNLSTVLAGGQIKTGTAAASQPQPQPQLRQAPAASVASVAQPVSGPPAWRPSERYSDDPWSKVAASFSVATFMVSLFILYHVVSQG